MKRSNILATFVVLMASAGMGNADWQLARDFSATKNDSTCAFQFGYLTGAEGTFNPYTVPDVASEATVGWHAEQGWDFNGNVTKNTSDTDRDFSWGSYSPAGKVLLQGGMPTRNPWVAARWFAPSEGDYNVSAIWTNQEKDGTPAEVVMRDTLTGMVALTDSYHMLTAFVGTDGSVADGRFTYDKTLHLTAGQNVDFVIESGCYSGVQRLGLDVTITALPEPSSILLAACGLIGLLVYAWRKRN